MGKVAHVKQEVTSKLGYPTRDAAKAYAYSREQCTFQKLRDFVKMLEDIVKQVV